MQWTRSIALVLLCSIRSQSLPIASTMIAFVAFACFLAVVQSMPSGAPILVSPPARPVGALTNIILGLQIAGQAFDVDAIFQNNLQLVANHIQQGGGLQGDLDEYLAFVSQVETGFWQQIADNEEDLTWVFERQLAQAYADIEREFSLVINQPLVRSWLRQLRQIARIGLNRTLDMINQLRTQYLAVSDNFKKQALDLIRNSKCGDSQSLQDRFNQIVAATTQQLLPILGTLKQQQAQITGEIILQGFALANNIYQAEIEALRYFVS